MSEGVVQQVNDPDVGLLADQCHARIEKIMGHHEARSSFDCSVFAAEDWVEAMYDRVELFYIAWLALCNAVVPVDMRRG